MKLRLFVVLAGILMVSSSMFAGGLAQVESTTWQLAPIVATVDGWDTGLTIINLSTENLTVTDFVATRITGEIITAKITFPPVIPGGRFSVLASQILGEASEFNGTLRMTVRGAGAKKALCYMAVFELGTRNMAPIPMVELTSR